MCGRIATKRAIKEGIRQKAHAAVMEQFKGSVISLPTVSPCRGACYADFAKHKNEKLLNECLGDCEAAEAIALVAEKLNRELNDTFFEMIWKGGDIDPVPFEKSVRERFSRPRGGR